MNITTKLGSYEFIGPSGVKTDAERFNEFQNRPGCAEYYVSVIWAKWVNREDRKPRNF